MAERKIQHNIRSQKSSTDEGENKIKWYDVDMIKKINHILKEQQYLISSDSALLDQIQYQENDWLLDLCLKKRMDKWMNELNGCIDEGMD